MSFLTILGMALCAIGGIVSSIGGAQDAKKNVEKTVKDILDKK